MDGPVYRYDEDAQDDARRWPAYWDGRWFLHNHGGASVKTVQLSLGHTQPTITLNTYLGHWPDAVDTTRSLIDSALGRPGAQLRAAR
jgi:integrase